ncbi:Polymerase delta interacting protein 2 [Trichuris trichiura]|uniref:Polymerase delta interacting protein 2 n=1 Tax=Trichuris trichiura TaxID=36087 RepID=A0A077ZJ90_TRITR|nr:Polymerase delta interacting protein 2 [Trichuris trichiura]
MVSKRVVSLFGSCRSIVYSCWRTESVSTPTRRYSNVRLSEIGRFDLPKDEGEYETGQLFLHSVFGYRGVVLFPWEAEVYDRNLQRRSSFQEQTGGVYKTPGGVEVHGIRHTYYQTLIDERDWPFIRAQPESVTFLGAQEGSRSLYAIPGLDYVAHEDILPYHSNEPVPIIHELFERFLIGDPGKDPAFTGRETLKAWREKNHPWLALSSVHRETTECIRVTVIPFYMGCRESQNTSVYWWRYCIRLENLSKEAVVLRERHWKIFSISGTLDTVRGRGVVGLEPVLSPAIPAFQYSSHVSLHAPSGHMWGSFKMERTNGQTFECRIPPFALESCPEEPTSGAAI